MMIIDSTKQAMGGQLPTINEAANTTTAVVNTDDVMLPDPVLDLLASGDAFEQIAALMTKSSRQDRKQARECAQLEERNIMAEGRKRVQAMRDEADAIRKEAYMRGATQIAGGAMTLQSSLQLGRGDANNAAYDAAYEKSLGKVDAKVVDEAAQKAAQQAAEQAEREAVASYGAVLDSSAKATAGIGEILAGGYKGDQADLRADAAEHETLSDAAKRRSEEYRDQVRDARETLDKIADFLKEARAAQKDATSAAIFRA